MLIESLLKVILWAKDNNLKYCVWQLDYSRFLIYQNFVENLLRFSFFVYNISRQWQSQLSAQLRQWQPRPLSSFSIRNPKCSKIQIEHLRWAQIADLRWLSLTYVIGTVLICIIWGVKTTSVIINSRWYLAWKRRWIFIAIWNLIVAFLRLNCFKSLDLVNWLQHFQWFH